MKKIAKMTAENIDNTGLEEQKMHQSSIQHSPNSKYNTLAQGVIKGVGGKENITSVTNCATRLRFELVDNTIVDESIIKQAGATGVMKVGRKNAQVIIGTHVQQVADVVDELLK
ncbi:glucose PTS transporter subunit EIIB [Macrococcoides caseolyticum]|uniref:glucose PTS transporter subunit EIIB n=1 Tax=Macrococcoides caseolyticum TaxID=69966 RepID=UPI001F465C34|nr:PTS glucose/sucrose transporter subunit IIB [Macrococcus caseolyticus]MCE4956351.1 glucose PTS transporter subunit EIIB [Macrococcus caseolyticus]